jgi:hypothetical protein
MVGVLPDYWQVAFEYLRAHGRFPNLENPRTFNEKVAWRKLFERDERFPRLIDKITVKDIVGDRFGHNLITPTLAVYDDVAQMEFDKPPLSAPPYVIKANHGSGMNIFVRNGPSDVDAIRAKLGAWLSIDHYHAAKEWAYSQIRPRILVEPLIGGPNTVTDYKFHVFSGTVYAIEVVMDRFADYRINFYRPNWTLLDIKRYAGRPRTERPVPPPQHLASMLQLAESIGCDFSYVRVDLYEVDSAIKFGEMTFYTGAGNDRFEPDQWDVEFGQQWNCLPS